MAQRVLSLAHWGAFYAVVDGGRLVRCEPFEQDPAPSRLLESMPAMVYSKTRVAAPAVREGWLNGRDRNRCDRNRCAGERYVEVGWDEALELVAGELRRVRERFGADGIFGGSYGWSSAGRFHHARTQVRRFLFSGGGCVDQAGNYSWGCAQFLLPHVIGTFAPVSGKGIEWRSVAAHTKLFVAFGGLFLKNAQISPGGVGQHTMQRWMEEARRAGCRFVCIGPVRDPNAAEWIPIRPNTDAALMLALLQELVATGRRDAGFLRTHCHGWEKLAATLGDKTPEWAEAITGVPAARTRALAAEMAAGRTLLSAAWSLQRAHHGEQPYWAMIALAAALGQIGLPGGGFGFGHGSMFGAGEPRVEGGAPSMPMGDNPARRAIPVARIADMLLEPGAPYDFDGERGAWPDIRLVYWAGGNPFHHHQDLARLERAWQKPETVVVHETWWTATARRADIVLPATTTLERNDLGGGANDRWIFAMPQAIAPVGGARSDFDIFRSLAARLGHEERFTEGLGERQWIERIYAHAARSGALPPFAEFWARGYVEQAVPERAAVLFEEFRRDPARHRLQTPSGKIELHSERIAGFAYDDCPPQPAWLPPAEWLGAPLAKRYPLHLVTVQPPDRLHGQLDPGPVSQGRKVAGREAVRLNPADASSRGIAAGDVVVIESARGRCLAGAVLDADIMAGVAVMSTGAWYDPDSSGLERHGNPNVLAFDRGTSRLAQGPSPLSLLVEIRMFEGEAPRVRAYDVPLLA
ncbi:MAG: molybdopterin-dependent oxidoreductase [Betaproteobacteria bacterium]